MQMSQDTGEIRFTELFWTGSSGSTDEYGLIDLLIEDTEQTGDSYYIIGRERMNLVLWKICVDKNGVEFHERVDAATCGITEEDILDAVRMCRTPANHPGVWPITGHIAQKLRIIEKF